MTKKPNKDEKKKCVSKERNESLEKALDCILAQHSYDIDAVATETGLSVYQVASALARRGMHPDELAIFESADRRIAQRLLGMREKSLTLIENVIKEPDSQRTGLKAAEIALNYAESITERRQLVQMAKELEKKLGS